MLLAIVFAVGLTACGKRNNGDSGSSGGGNNGGDNTTHTINIYISSGEMTVRGDDEYVQKKIQDKFYQDRGYKIDLNVQIYSESDFNTTMSNKMATSDWDAAIGYIGQAGIDEIVISQNVCMELSDLIATYDNLYDLVKDELTATTTIDGAVHGVPSLELTNQYGVLVRTDYMARVGYTTEAGHNDDLGNVNEAPNGKLKTLVTIDDFTDMLRRMKAQISEVKYPLSGYPWDIESTLAVGPYSNAGYTFKSAVGVDADGRATEVVPGQIADDYLKTLQLEYTWASEKLWEEENYTAPRSKKLQAFVNGTTAVYAVDPEITNLIRVARQTKEANSSATFTILEPLFGTENGVKTDKRGYMAKQSANSCLVINKKSSKAEIILEYLDWLAEDEANYNLATYGVENEHWIDAGEGKYVYPENKAERYEVSPPYSGKFGLLKWQEYSYKLYDNYTAEEYEWIDTVRNAPTFSNVCENMLFLGEDTDMALNHQTAENDFFQDLLTKVWAGTVNPTAEFATQQAKYKTTASSYIVWLTEQYNKYVMARK